MQRAREGAKRPFCPVSEEFSKTHTPLISCELRLVLFTVLPQVTGQHQGSCGKVAAELEINVHVPPRMCTSTYSDIMGISSVLRGAGIKGIFLTSCVLSAVPASPCAAVSYRVITCTPATQIPAPT